MRDILSYNIKVLKGCNTDMLELPEKIRNNISEQIDDNDINKLITKIMAERENGFVAVVTKNESVAAFIKALNLNLKSNRIIIIFNDEVDVSGVELEMKEKSLTDSRGECYFPEETNYDNIYHDGDRIIVKTNNSISIENTVYTHESRVFGMILDDKYHYRNILGTVDNYLENLSISDKARLFKEIIRNDISSLTDVLVLNERDEYIFISLPLLNREIRIKDIYSLYLELFLGVSSKYSIGEAVIAMANSNLSASVMEDASRIVANKFVSAKIKLPSERVLLNTIERLLIEEE